MSVLEDYVLISENVPEWRWNTICDLVDNGRAMNRAEKDVYMRRGYNFKQRDLTAVDTPGRRSLLRDYPDIFHAHAMWVYPASEKWIIEAAIMTRADNEKIAQFVGKTPEVIAAYEKLFYDIRAKLDNPGYVMSRVVMPSIIRGLHERDFDLLLKSIAYVAGWDIFVSFMSGGPLTDTARSWVKEGVYDDILRKSYYALKRVDVNNTNATEIITQVLKLKEIETEQGTGVAQQEATRVLAGFLDICTTSVIPNKEPLLLAEPRAVELLGSVATEKYAGQKPVETKHGKTK